MPLLPQRFRRVLPSPLKNPFPLRDKEIGGKDSENHIDQHIGNISGDTARRGHGRRSDGSHHIAEGSRQRLNQPGQTLCQIRRKTRRDSLQVVLHLPQVLQQRLIELRQRSDKAVDLPDNPGNREISAEGHQGHSPDDNQHGAVLPHNLHPFFHEAHQGVRDHGDDPAYDKRHEKYQKSGQKKTDQYYSHKKQQKIYETFLISAVHTITPPACGRILMRRYTVSCGTMLPPLYFLRSALCQNLIHHGPDLVAPLLCQG